MTVRDDYPAITVLHDAWIDSGKKQPEAVRALIEIDLLRATGDQLLALFQDATERLEKERHLGQLMYLAQQRWQSMAEDLWEYIQEWHIDSCSMHWINGAGMHPECSCHRVIEAKWNKITNAAEWGDDEEEEP